LNCIVRGHYTTRFVYGRRGEPLSPAAEAATQKLCAAAETLLADNNPNLFGQWCIADTDLALMLKRLILNGDPVPAKLIDYAARQWERPSVQRWLKLDRPAL
jgi:glutathione S-transferase